MNQSKFSLADLLTVLGTLGFGFFCFLSLNFLSLGETIPSLIVATVIALLLGGLAFGLKLFKKTIRNFKTCIIWEWVLLLFFIIFAFVAIFPFSHYFVVSEQKANIQSKVIANIKQAEGLFADYEHYANNRLNIYKSRLNSVVAAKNVNPSEYRNYGFVNGTDDNTQVENKMFTLRAQLYPTNYSDTINHNGMKEVGTTWLANAKNTIADWKPIGIVDVINKVETNITTWKNDLHQFSSFKAQGEIANDFEYPLTFDDVTGKMTELNKPTSLSIIYAIGFYTLMLLPWIIQRRSTKSKYSLFSFLKRKNNKTISEFTIDY